MSVPALSLRPAVDSRPPVDVWSGVSGSRHSLSPDQPPLRLVEVDEIELLVPELVDGPALAKIPITVDLVPSGAHPERESELTEQARTWAPWFALLLLEGMDGRRPLESLGRWLDDWVLAEVSRRVRLLRRTRSRTPAVASPPPPVIASLRAQLSHPRVLEVAVHVRRGGRSAAWAFQLVRIGDRWRCSALALDPVPDRPLATAATR